jgi:FkbM family methyltransferase
MESLDLVVTADTATGHLAGALGRPVWIALNRVPDWRWMLDREDSPWYPTARLFRQPQVGDWESVFRRMAEALREAVEDSGGAVRETGPKPPSRGPLAPDVAPAVETPGFNRLKRCRHGLMLYNRHDIYIGRSLDLYGEFSEAEAALLRYLLKPGDVVIEAGANIGAHTLPLARMVGPAGAVYAFEPQRIVFQTLCANMALNSVTNAHCRHAALGDAAGEATVPELDYSTENNFGGLGLEGHSGGETVPVITVDSLGLKRCDLLKVDVEGMETAVLRSAGRMIEACAPVLYVENDRPNKSAELIGFIASLGYRMYWHKPPLYSTDNYFRNPTNVFGDLVSANMLCLPARMEPPFPDLEPVEHGATA